MKFGRYSGTSTGFTLIEVLITMLVVGIAMIPIGMAISSLVETSLNLNARVGVIYNDNIGTRALQEAVKNMSSVVAMSADSVTFTRRISDPDVFSYNPAWEVTLQKLGTNVILRDNSGESEVIFSSVNDFKITYETLDHSFSGDSVAFQPFHKFFIYQIFSITQPYVGFLEVTLSKDGSTNDGLDIGLIEAKDTFRVGENYSGAKKYSVVTIPQSMVTTQPRRYVIPLKAWDLDTKLTQVAIIFKPALPNPTAQTRSLLVWGADSVTWDTSYTAGGVCTENGETYNTDYRVQTRQYAKLVIWIDVTYLTGVRRRIPLTSNYFTRDWF